MVCFLIFYIKRFCMKKILFIAAIGLCTVISANAQDHKNMKDHKDHEKMKLKDNDVPQAVKSAFTSQFPGASDVDWKMKNGNYKAKFDMNGTDHMAEMTQSGELVCKGVEIKKDELPTLVSDAVRTGYTSNTIDEAYKIEKGGNTYYLVKLDGNPDKKLMYDTQGKLVKEKMHKK